MAELLTLIVGGWLFKVLWQWLDKFDLQRSELESLKPPPPSPPPKSRKQLVADSQALLDEELRWCKLINDPVARDAATLSAHARFRQRIHAASEMEQ